MMEGPMIKELEERIRALRCALADADPDFETALIIGRVNLYYLTGTMQDGLLILKRDGAAFLFVRKSYERAKQECPLDIVYPMSTYRDILGIVPSAFGKTYIEADVVPVSMLERLKKYFQMDQVKPLDRILLNLRAIKSPYELSVITRSGQQHEHLFEEIVPAILKEGMSEAQFHGELFNAMVKLGHHGVSRFSMFQIEVVAGQLGFGEN
jgi:Xaa-Pro aminopeptidase